MSSKFDFKSYHVRAINAANDEEKKAINQELKDFYAGLSEEEPKTPKPLILEEKSDEY